MEVGRLMYECRYCEEIIDYDSASDIWRCRMNGVISCRSNNKKSSYRWTHLPKVKEKV